tara:strand:- start:141 stop:347 length:207 start_codon:yes stop_codon:yes gene_type:complete
VLKPNPAVSTAARFCQFFQASNLSVQYLHKFKHQAQCRSRSLDLAETIQKEFKLADFQKEYPFYPLVS